jgi:hypothetical protein
MPLGLHPLYATPPERLSLRDDREARGVHELDEVDEDAGPDAEPKPDVERQADGDETEERRDKRVGDVPLIARVLRLLEARGPLPVKEIARALEAKDHPLRDTLRAARDEGRIELVGKARHARWRLVGQKAAPARAPRTVPKRRTRAEPKPSTKPARRKRTVQTSAPARSVPPRSSFAALLEAMSSFRAELGKKLDALDQAIAALSS